MSHVILEALGHVTHKVVCHVILLAESHLILRL